MKNAAAGIALFFVVLTMAGCRGPLVPGAEFTDGGRVVFVAEGSSVVAREDDSLALLEARVAARTMAMANLLAKIKGMEVSGRETVADLMFESQEAATAVQGFLSRVHVSYEQSPAEEGQPELVTAVAALELERLELAQLSDYAR